MPFLKKLFYLFNILRIKILGKPMYSIIGNRQVEVDNNGNKITDTITVKYCIRNNASQEIMQCFNSFQEAQTFRDELQNKSTLPV